MIRRPPPKVSWLSLLLIAAAVVLWALDQKNSGETKTRSAPVGKTQTPSKPKPAEKEQPGSTRPGAAAPENVGGYEIYRNCSLASDHSNDGDSFKVRLPDGRVEIFRLYFVDTPESAFRRYSGGDTNHKRIREQAAYLGGITPEQAVEIGKKSKALTLGLLEETPFTIHTCWDSPYRDQRYHAHVEVKENGRIRWLDELLVERGFARILTKPADMPDGTPANVHKDHLRDLESKAKREGRGAWGL